MKIYYLGTVPFILILIYFSSYTSKLRSQNKPMPIMVKVLSIFIGLLFFASGILVILYAFK